MFTVWVRRDNKANSDKLSSCGGPRLDKVFWRVTRDARTNEVIYSESIHVNFSKSVLHARMLVPRDTVTELWYELGSSVTRKAETSHSDGPAIVSPALPAERDEKRGAESAGLSHDRFTRGGGPGRG